MIHSSPETAKLTLRLNLNRNVPKRLSLLRSLCGLCGKMKATQCLKESSKETTSARDIEINITLSTTCIRLTVLSNIIYNTSTTKPLMSTTLPSTITSSLTIQKNPNMFNLTMFNNFQHHKEPLQKKSL